MKISFLSVVLIAATIFSTIPLILTLNQPSRVPGITFQRPPAADVLFRKFAYLTGAVAKPGVYEIQSSTRLFELLAMAGGATSQADMEAISTKLNLASLVPDEEHVVVPFIRKPTSTETASGNNLININTATSAELQQLPGVGESTASKIIFARPFKSIEGLKDVSGIGDKTFAELKDKVTI